MCIPHSLYTCYNSLPQYQTLCEDGQMMDTVVYRTPEVLEELQLTTSKDRPTFLSSSAAAFHPLQYTVSAPFRLLPTKLLPLVCLLPIKFDHDIS